MPNKDFLENYPLYKKFPFDAPKEFRLLPDPAIQMHCHVCRGERTFRRSAEYDDQPPRSKAMTAYSQYGGDELGGHVAKATFLCSACQKFNYAFLIRFDDKHEFIMKVGQYPGYDLKGDKETNEKLSDEYVGLYAKGMVCESQGYGIGAYAYYRRIVEQIIDRLLIDVRELVDESERDNYDKELEEVKQKKHASEKIAIIKDKLPAVLRPRSQNPLGLLYGKLSEGIHHFTDDECLDSAISIRKLLESFVHLLNASLGSGKVLEESAQNIQKQSKVKP